MFCKNILSFGGITAGMRRSVNAVLNSGNPPNPWNKKKGRTPEKVQRYKSVISRSMSRFLVGETEQKLLPLKVPTSYFRHKNTNLLNTIPNQNFSTQTEKKLKTSSTSPLKDLAVAIDCEMVACRGNGNSLARCTVVDYENDVLLDLYVRQTAIVWDYKTRYSGITKELLEQKDSVTFTTARELVKKVIEGKLLIGHTLGSDLSALKLDHPSFLTVDIARNVPQSLFKELKTKSKKSGLRSMADCHLSRLIQKGSHCSVEDAQATMDLFKLIEDKWLLKYKFVIDELVKQKKSYLDDQYWPAEIKNE